MKIHIKTTYEFDPESGEYVVVEDVGYDYLGPVTEIKGGSGGTQTTTTVAEPPAWQVPYMQKYLSEAQNIYETKDISAYPGSTVAPLTPEITSGLAGISAAAPYQAGIADMAGRGLADQFAAMDPTTNPYFQRTLEASIRPATQALREQVLPQIGQGAVAAGQYGGSRQGIAEGKAIDAWQRNVLDTAAGMGNQAYGQGLQAGQRALAFAPQVQQMYTAPGQTQLGVGEYGREYEQQMLNDLIEKWNFEQQAPYNELQWLAGITGNPLGTTQTSVAPGPTSNRFMGGVGGALAGASLGAMKGSVGGPAGAAIGGVLGLLMS